MEKDFKKKEPVRLFTSECVGVGHPDKVADYISDSVVSAIIKEDPKARVACETMCYSDGVVLAGEITTTATVDYEQIARDAMREIGYIHKDCPFNADEVKVETHIHAQSPDIALGTNDTVEGAGDQGFVTGFACTETTDYMPLPTSIARALVVRLAEYISEHIEEEDPVLRPDTKSQCTVAYGRGHQPKYVDTVVVAASHSANVDIETVRDLVRREVIDPVLKNFGFDIRDVPHIYINSTGKFAAPYYGAYGDVGLTGRKIVCDQYGCSSSVGGGAFSGKDASKVDRSAAYMARKVAKTICAAGYAETCTVQIAYSIGVKKPVSININCMGTNTKPVGLIAKAVNTIFDLTPAGITRDLKLRDGLDFQDLSIYGHYGEWNPVWTPEWEQLDKVSELQEYVESNFIDGDR